MNDYTRNLIRVRIPEPNTGVNSVVTLLEDIEEDNAPASLPDNVRNLLVAQLPQPNLSTQEHPGVALFEHIISLANDEDSTLDVAWEDWLRFAAPDGNTSGSKLVEYFSSLIDYLSEGEPSVTSVTITGDDTVEVGSSITLTAIVDVEYGADTSVTWSSDDEDIATVVDGEVTGLTEGVVTITATSVFDGTKDDTHSVTVTEG